MDGIIGLDKIVRLQYWSRMSRTRPTVEHNQGPGLKALGVSMIVEDQIGRRRCRGLPKMIHAHSNLITTPSLDINPATTLPTILSEWYRGDGM
jgi:hypothetical protein